MKPFPSIAIVGAGALGGYYGARLAQHGHEVHFLIRSDYAYIAAHGFKVRSAAGDFCLPPDKLHLYNDPADMPRVDLVIVTIKTTENSQFGRIIGPLLHDDTAILTLQNGLGNEDQLAGLFGARRVLGGMAFVCINRTGPGEIEHLEPGYIRLGEFAGPGRSERAEALCAMFRASRVDAGVLDDLKGGRWDKLVWNVPFNGLGALLDATTDELLSSAAGVRLVRGIMEEVIRAAGADGVTLPPGVADRQIGVTRAMGAYRTSTQIDRRRGRPMEIESIFAAPARIARAAKVEIPLMEMLLFALGSMDSHGRG